MKEEEVTLNPFGQNFKMASPLCQQGCEKAGPLLRAEGKGENLTSINTLDLAFLILGI